MPKITMLHYPGKRVESPSMSNETQLSVLVPDWAQADLKAMAAQRQRSVGAEVRLAIFAHIKDWEKDTPEHEEEVAAG